MIDCIGAAAHSAAIALAYKNINLPANIPNNKYIEKGINLFKTHIYDPTDSSLTLSKATQTLAEVALYSLTFTFVERATGPIFPLARLAFQLLPVANTYCDVHKKKVPLLQKSVNHLNKICLEAALATSISLLCIGNFSMGVPSFVILALTIVNKYKGWTTGNEVNKCINFLGAAYSFWCGNAVTQSITLYRIVERNHEKIFALFSDHLDRMVPRGQ